MPCFSHTLQLAVEVVLKLPEVSRALARCRQLVGHFNRSAKSSYVTTKASWSTSQKTGTYSRCYQKVEFCFLHGRMNSISTATTACNSFGTA